MLHTVRKKVELMEIDAQLLHEPSDPLQLF